MKRIIYASTSYKKLKIGDKYILNSNITLGHVTVPDCKQDGKYTDEFIQQVTDAAEGNVLVAKNKSSIKLTPGCVITISKIREPGGRFESCGTIGDSDIEIYIDSWNDFKKLDLVGSEPTAPKEHKPVEYALYGCPDIYGRAETKWHWTMRDADETEKDFKASVKRSAAAAAEKEFWEYDPKSIKIKYFASEDAFIRKCNKLGISPSL